MIDNTASRAWNVAEYLFAENAHLHIANIRKKVLDLVHPDCVEAFLRYLSGDEYRVSINQFDLMTAGFGDLDYGGWFEFGLPLDFVSTYIVPDSLSHYRVTREELDEIVKFLSRG